MIPNRNDKIAKFIDEASSIIYEAAAVSRFLRNWNIYVFAVAWHICIYVHHISDICKLGIPTKWRKSPGTCIVNIKELYAIHWIN